MSEKFRLDRKIGFQNTFYTKCINVIIDSIGPSIILRSIYMQKNMLPIYPRYLPFEVVNQYFKVWPYSYLLVSLSSNKLH